MLHSDNIFFVIKTQVAKWVHHGDFINATIREWISEFSFKWRWQYFIWKLRCLAYFWSMLLGSKYSLLRIHNKNLNFILQRPFKKRPFTRASQKKRDRIWDLAISSWAFGPHILCKNVSLFYFHDHNKPLYRAINQ